MGLCCLLGSVQNAARNEGEEAPGILLQAASSFSLSLSPHGIGFFYYCHNVAGGLPLRTLCLSSDPRQPIR